MACLSVLERPYEPAGFDRQTTETNSQFVLERLLFIFKERAVVHLNFNHCCLLDNNR